MRTNIRRLVEQLWLPESKALLPLYEAIANSADAIEERYAQACKGSIHVKLLSTHDLAEQAGDASPVVDGFEIRDDGTGFTNANTLAFNEAYTASKVKLGGKGVGRFTFLRVFSSCNIHSVFESDSRRLARDFPFSIETETAGSENVVETEENVGTTVRVRGIDLKYQSAWQLSAENLADRVVSHFLVRLAANAFPKVVLEGVDGDLADVQERFKAKVIDHTPAIPLLVQGQSLTLQVLKQTQHPLRHVYHLCANGRSVSSASLAGVLPELPDRFVDKDQKAFALTVLVTGKYLDDNSNLERTRIGFASDDEGELELDGPRLTRDALVAAMATALRPHLKADLETTHSEKIQQIRSFVEREAPEYRPLLNEKYRDRLETQIQPGLRGAQLDEKLLHLRRELEDDIRKESREIVKLIDKESFDKYQEMLATLVAQINDVGKAKLAEYISHRRTILDLLDHSLQRSRADDKYPFEKVLHNVIFPMGCDSRELFLEQQNLWVIDERLTFHTIATSDRKLRSIKGMKGTSSKEPDIFLAFYDHPVGVAEQNENPGGLMVIVEFKRPGRNDYRHDPGEQVLDVIRDIRKGNVTDLEGRPVNPTRFRFMGYLIADLTSTLRDRVSSNWFSTEDNEGYFRTLTDGGYAEIISYDRLIRDAKKRNRILFEKLGVHKD